LEDRVFDGVGHEISPDMVKELIRFVDESLAADVGSPKSQDVVVTKGNKI
jgi:hypothetical protein